VAEEGEIRNNFIPKYEGKMCQKKVRGINTWSKQRWEDVAEEGEMD
jgi:hypothetical protein